MMLLAGGGHSHVLVLADFARRQLALPVTVVSPDRHTTYTGMVPGILAGQYAPHEAQIDVASLARRAGAHFIAGRVARVDAERRTVEITAAPAVSYDVMSFDIGARAAPAPADDGAPLIALKPIEAALEAIDRALAMPLVGTGRRVVVAGAGAGGCEIAFALAARLRDEPGRSITICDDAPRPVAERGRRTSLAVERAFREHAIRFVGGARVRRIARDAVHFERGDPLAVDLVVWAAGVSAPPLFSESQLPTDTDGYLRVGADLRCAERPQLFAAGDCATLTSYPDLPKAGVYAVRQAPILAHNLRTAVGGGAPRGFRPQRRFLALLNTGDGRAILSYGAGAARGRWAWRLKDWIDRRFVNGFR